MPVDKDKEHELWRQRWRERNIGFHLDEVNKALLEHGDQLLAGGPHRVLVPLSGKSVDLTWLVEQGHEVIGVELVEGAVREFFREQHLEPAVETIDRHTIFRSGALTVVCGDIFELDRSHIGAADRIWDRAALVALPAHLRSDYARHLRQLASPGWVMLLAALEYDTTVMAGPPWCVPEEEVRLYFPGASVEILSRTHDIDPRMRERGHTWWRQTTYLIRDG